MFRKSIAALAACVLLVTATGCELLPEKSQEQTLYNGYMGLTVVVPSGWYVETLSEVNLTATPEESATLGSMQIDIDYEDGGYYYDLVRLENRNSSSNDNHVVLELFAEDYAEVFPTLMEYVDACEYTYTGDLEDGYFGDLVSREEVQLNGATFQKLSVSVSHVDNDVPYIEDYYFANVGGLYLTCYVNYWSDNPASKEEVEKSLEEAFELDLTKVGQGGAAAL